MKKSIFFIFLCFLSLGFIFFNSSQTGEKSNSRSGVWADKLVNMIVEIHPNIPGLSDKKINKKELNTFVRKCAHGFEFAILAIVLSFSFGMLNINKKDLIIYTLFIVLLAAVFDEFFQLYIPDRTSSVIDVLIDFVGGILGTIIAYPRGKCPRGKFP